MKKRISVLVASVLSMSLFAACAGGTAATTAGGTAAGTTAAGTTASTTAAGTTASTTAAGTTASTTAAGTTASTTAAGTTASTTAAGTTASTTTAGSTVAGPKTAEAGSIVKMGLGIKASVAKSSDFAADKAGAAQADVVIAAVGFDKDGKVASIKIDNAQTKVEYNADGTLKSDPAATYKTKQEKKDEYGMKKASAIGKEWYEQAEALSAWMQGKTAEEIKNMKTKPGADEAHPAVPDEADLATSVTISVQDYIAVVEEAAKNAVDVEGGADTVGLGIHINIGKSAGKTAEKGAVAQIDNTITAVALKGDKVAASILDVVQAKVEYDAEGKVTTDKAAEVSSKVDLGDKYGMKAASSIKKEWYEQAKALTEWTVGKTNAEIQGIESEEKDGKKIVKGDLASSVTVGVADYLKVFDHAIMNAR